GAAQPLRLAPADEVELPRRAQAAGDERAALVAVELVLEERGAERVGALAQRHAGDQPIGVLDRQRPEKERVDGAEDRRVGPDAEGQREPRDQRQTLARAQHPDAITKVLPQRVHDAPRYDNGRLMTTHVVPDARTEFKAGPTNWNFSRARASKSRLDNRRSIRIDFIGKRETAMFTKPKARTTQWTTRAERAWSWDSCTPFAFGLLGLAVGSTLSHDIQAQDRGRRAPFP